MSTPQDPCRAALIKRFRRFNRFYTRTIGLLNRRLNNGPLNLAEARTLFEIRRTPCISAGVLAEMLDMDRGQLSRILSKLQTSGLIERDSAPSGRKAVPLQPTPQGIALLENVETAADSHAAALLRQLDAEQGERLGSALEEVERLLAATPPPEDGFALRPPRSGDMAWIMERHARLYGREHGFDADFERYVLLGLAAFAQLPDPQRSGLFLAESQGRRLGSVGIVEASDNMAQLRWLLVTPEARGKGVGRALVAHACAFAAEQGYAGIILWTLSSLAPARALYQSLGFKLTESRPGTMGGRVVTEERWEHRLA
ncbi:MAG: GNAT family N-acetyltransferase [Desulfovibrio sp.]